MTGTNALLYLIQMVIIHARPVIYKVLPFMTMNVNSLFYHDKHHSSTGTDTLTQKQVAPDKY